MKNKQVKQMICDALEASYSLSFWFDSKTLMYFEPPYAYFEGDECCFYLGEKISLTANQLKGK